MREGMVQLDQLLLNANDKSLGRDEKIRHKTRGEFMCSGRVGSSSSTCVTSCNLDHRSSQHNINHIK